MTYFWLGFGAGVLAGWISLTVYLFAYGVACAGPTRIGDD